MASPPCTSFKSLSLQIIPVDGLRRPTIRFWVEIGFRRVGQAESATLDFANVFACRAGDEAVELSLYHLRYLLVNEKTLPRAGQRENHTAPDRGTKRKQPALASCLEPVFFEPLTLGGQCR